MQNSFKPAFYSFESVPKMLRLSFKITDFILIVLTTSLLSACGGSSSGQNDNIDQSSRSAQSEESHSSSSSLSSSSIDVLSSSVSSIQSSQISSSVFSSSSSILISASSSSAVSSPINSSSANQFYSISLKSDITRVQPMTGIVFWSDNSDALSRLGQDIQLEFAYMLYRDVVTAIGTYNWNAVDTKLAQAAARGHQMILRFRDTYPGETQKSIPDNLPSTISKVEGLNTFIPDWSSTDLQDFIIDFFTKFSARYDKDSRLAFIQVGFGSYSEYHLYDGNPMLGKNFPSKAFQTTFLNHMASSFSTTPWSISIDAASSEYSPIPANNALKNLTFGLFDDSFMHATHSEDDNEYNRASWLFFGSNRYQTSPAGGEFSYYTTFDQQHVLDTPNGPYGRNFESFVGQYHISYMIGNDQYEYQNKSRIKSASMATGYAFRITTLESNGTEVHIGIRNEGVAPIYYDAYPNVNGHRATQTLKGLQPDSTLNIDMTIEEHNPLDITVKIDSDRLVSGQVIQFNADL